MPKVVLTNSETGKNEEFEPIDAREILRQEGSIYSPSKVGNELIGQPMDWTANFPQLQGDDAELQTGLSVEKYRRDQVVKAVPSQSEFAPVASAGEFARAFPGRTMVTAKQGEEAEQRQRAAEEGAEVTVPRRGRPPKVAE